MRAVRAPHVAANAEPCVHAVGDGTVAHEDPAPDAQKLRRQTLAQNAVRRVQLVVVDHHRATAPSRVGEARGREDLARRYVVDVFAWQRHISAKAVWEAKVGLSRRFLASISHQALYRAFHRWREAARKLRALDRKVARCVHRMTRNAVANAFIEWAELVEAKRAREAKEAADTRRWEAKVRRAERYILAMAKRKLSDAFTQWKANFRVIHADRASVRVVTSRMVKRKMFAAFNAWVHATEKRRRDRFIVRRALAKLARNLLANSFVAWYGVDSLRRGAEEEEARRWRENILKCERYVHRMSRRTLSRAFTRWETERSRMKTQRRMLRNCVARLSHRMQYAAFSSWWSITIERRRHRALVRRAVARISRDAMSSTFFAWQRHISAKAVWEAKVGLSRRFLASISHQALYRAFHRWREAARKLRALDRKVARCVHRMTRNAVANAFIEWAELVETKRAREAKEAADTRRWEAKVRRAERYILAMAKRKLSDAFTQWKANFRVIHADRASVRVVTSRMVKRKMFAAFNAWVHATEKRRRDRFIVRRALAKLARNLLANSFVAWYGVGSLRRGAEEEEARRWRENILKCERYVHRMSRRTLSRAFTRWETERSRMKTQRRMLRNCVARLSHRMQYAAFSSWWSITIERRRHRARW